MNAVAYLRKSTGDHSHYSLEYQEKGIRNYCTSELMKIRERVGQRYKVQWSAIGPQQPRVAIKIKDWITAGPQ